MSETENTQPTEREELEARANQLGIKFHPNIGDDKLREKVNAAISGEGTSEGDDVSEDTIDNGGQYSDDKAPDNESETARRKRKQLEASELVRVQVTNMNPNKKEWDGEMIAAGNRVVGTFKKYVPYNVPWHVPRVIYNVLRDRQCQVFVTERDDRGRQVRRGKQIQEFNVTVLPPLSKEELQELAQRQAMANGTNA